MPLSSSEFEQAYSLTTNGFAVSGLTRDDGSEDVYDYEVTL